jgi:aminoglycoside 3-N-acetyltransferase
MPPKSNDNTRKNITKKEIIENLREAGLAQGDHVVVTISYGKIGNVLGGPETILESLLEVLGPGGTLVMNTFTENAIPAQMRRNLIFNPSTSVSITGYVTELFRLKPDSVRSSHPMSSIVAAGRYSDFLIKDHDEDVHWVLPYFKLAKLGGKYLSIGLDDEMVAIRHVGQVINNIDNLIPVYYSTLYRNKRGIIELFYESFPCVRNLHNVVPILEKKGVINRGRIGLTTCLIGSAKEIMRETSIILSENPALNLCWDPFCIWCREMERKLDLYKIIKEPKFFQYPFIRELVALINKVRICKHVFLMYSDSWKSPKFMQIFYLYIYSKIRPYSK